MLFILVGVHGDLGYHCRDVVTKRKEFKGAQAEFTELQKYYYTDEIDRITKKENKRIVKKEFLDGFGENKDYVYTVNGVTIGFKTESIIKAVHGTSNVFTTFSSDDFSLLRSLKISYINQVRIVYTYIDDESNIKFLNDRTDLTEEERKMRLDLNRIMLKRYLEYPELFDGVIFCRYKKKNDFSDLDPQLEEQVKKAIDTQRVYLDDNYVELPYFGKEPYLFISYASDDIKEVRPYLQRLQLEGYRVWYDVAAGEKNNNWKKTISDKISSCKAVVLFLSKTSANPRRYVHRELEMAVHDRRPVIKISLDGTMEVDDPELQTDLHDYHLYDIRSEKYNNDMDFFMKYIFKALPSQTKKVKIDAKQKKT